MKNMNDVDELIREALQAENLDSYDNLGDASVPDMITEVFRGRLRWFGAIFMFMVMVFFVGCLYCGYRFLNSTAVVEQIRWGAGFFLSMITVIGGKTWYWMETGRLSTLREIKRVELLVAQLALELRAMNSGS